MPRHALILRILLCLALVLNGATAAFAGARADVREAATTAVEAPCHDAAMAHHGASQADTMPAEHPADDACCDTGACLDHCVGHAPVALFGVVLRMHDVPTIQPEARPRAGHLAPALPHPIRPPIG